KLLGATPAERTEKIAWWSDFFQTDVLALDAAQLNNFIQDPPGESIILKENLTHTEMLAAQSRLPEFPGTIIQESTKRSYSQGAAFSAVLGYVGSLTSGDREKYPNYFLTEKVGQTGLEAVYESFLRGEPGYQKYLTNARLDEKSRPVEKKGVPGENLVLNIDAGLQAKLFAALNEKYNQLRKTNKNVDGAAAVALNPQNGAVLALVSLPGYDNNQVVAGLTAEEFTALFANPQKPLFNRAIAGQYPVGSTIKPVVAAAALAEKIIDPRKKIDDLGGALTIANPYAPGVVYRFGDWAVHGGVDMYSAIAVSCNIYFYTIGGGYQDQEGLGIDRLAGYFRKFGFGQKTNIDLPGEKPGFVPTPAWKEETKKEPWYIGDTYHVAIGQGDFLATPLQLAMAASALVNGGTLYQPQIVDKIVDSAENVINDVAPLVLSSGLVDEADLAEIKKGMRLAVTDGSARQLVGLPVPIGGKTGTAQTGKGSQTHAWFAGFAPVDDPEIVLVVLVENGGQGHAAAVPVAKEVLFWYFSQK
ncbi:MAG: penicillin-binding protein 2, partial [Candidatus Portnoybacteria bacterium CG10_big_fil_rev_8_21_14_0_10_44_7]